MSEEKDDRHARGKNLAVHLAKSALTYPGFPAIPDVITGATMFLCSSVCVSLLVPGNEKKRLEEKLLRKISHAVGAIIEEAKTNEREGGG